MSIILDTGPLVALLNRRDTYHHWAVEQWSSARPPLLTCEDVIAEACFLVRTFPGDQAAVLDLVEQGVVEMPFLLADQAHHVARLLKKYRNVPMSLADGCLVHMAEQHANSVILTLDSDFRHLPQEWSRDRPVADTRPGTRTPPGCCGPRDTGSA